MEAFTRHTGIVATLDRANVDTDAIIPKQYLKSIRRTGFEVGLFHDWRYLADGSPNPDFELNRPAYRGASILLTRNNFGCGSSREHAVWAVVQYGFRVVIAPRRGAGDALVPAFADIFRNNSVKNGLLCIELDEAAAETLWAAVRAEPGMQATVDLAAQTIALPPDNPAPLRFEMDPGVKDYLLRGLDEIAMTLSLEADIAAFEARHDNQLAGAVAAPPLDLGLGGVT
ncbi:MAG: 3-isopropylmalate dehydratase small subunit [Candidatus Marinimicrobia bacterium]|nr:3-isopropylmalate dehydratase small subunit [Candidatus Neomarinimicrobiota bacterium]